jgi:hypothetical protein
MEKQGSATLVWNLQPWTNFKTNTCEKYARVLFELNTLGVKIR